ncbi:ornithine carbamoyltransferase chain F [Buchnera aphidicola (Cinara tujafilina)]|uniref:Ornithine carbamoyltransferase n=1 Tax=Buchnera aphidicola (Cinara tujafilina) TaxID=261317 RepID=F7WZF8_9GAMM|nr:ornithine carbamoyltransferase [Buchnera aphidicola]AEH39820.1 ornithine carbamoyltransferase chain F [Buchnera aphidicola (Cinara tujafilina)]
MKTLFKKNFLKFSDFTKKEILFLINFSIFLKKQKMKTKKIKFLKKKNIALIFEKKSTRTRCAFEIAARDQGAYTTYLNSKDTHLGYKESIEDTAKVLGCMYDGIQYRGYNDKTLHLLAKYSNIPVWNGLTDMFHPTQLLADLVTIVEIYPKILFEKLHIAYIGDAKNNIANTLIDAAYILGFNLNIIAPKIYWPEKNILNMSKNNKKRAKITCTENIADGVKNIDFIYTDTWISMGDKKTCWKEKIENLKDYQVNQKILKLTKNVNIKILHCLPALHDKNSTIGLEIHKKYNFSSGIEISNDIFSSKANLSFQQSINKLHSAKALLISTLSDKY